MMAPHWLDDVIQSKLDTKDAAQIAQALAESPKLLAAITAGLGEEPKPGIMGPSYAQVLRRKIQDAVGSEK